jgi:hypothetical protein
MTNEVSDPLRAAQSSKQVTGDIQCTVLKKTSSRTYLRTWMQKMTFGMFFLLYRSVSSKMKV